MQRVLSGPFEDGSILATLACGAVDSEQSADHNAHDLSPPSCIEAAHSRAAMPPKKKKPAAKKPAANKTPQKRPPEEQGPTPRGTWLRAELVFTELLRAHSQEISLRQIVT